MSEIGNISTYEHGEYHVVEWRIQGFSTLSQYDGTVYWSPSFSFDGEGWDLRIYPNGVSVLGTSGHVDLGLWKCRSGRFITLSLSLSLKTAKGEKLKEDHVTRDFHDYNRFHIFQRFISRAELTTLRSDLLPNVDLTVVCTMRRSAPGSRNFPERANMEASSQRVRPSTQSVRPSTQAVEVSTQTVEVTTQTMEVTNRTVEVTTQTVEAYIQTEEEKREAFVSGSSIWPYDEELNHDLKQLYISKEDCDVIIKVKDTEFPAHRAILKARSPVFASTFRHDMKENATGIVEIDDCDPSTFSDFLCYLYCGDANLMSLENVFGLFMAADKYQVSNLRTKCLEFVKRNLSVDTFCETLTLALRYSEAELVRLCIDYFKQNIPKIIVTVKWQIFLAENPIESNELFVKSFVPNNS